MLGNDLRIQYNRTRTDEVCKHESNTIGLIERADLGLLGIEGRITASFVFASCKDGDTGTLNL